VLLGCSSSGQKRRGATGADSAYRTVKSARAKTTVNLHHANVNRDTLFSRYNKTYTVALGDTLYSIAWRVGIDVKELISLNNLHSPYLIHKGDVLKVTGDIKGTTTLLFKSGNPPKFVSIQKNDKKVKIQCSGSLCTKNNQNKVVNKATKAYPKANASKKMTLGTGHTKNSNNIAAKKQTKKQTKKLKNNWRWPTEGKIIKTFLASKTGLKGISIENQRGTPIYAAAKGQVVYAGNGLRGYGNLIIIKHANDYLSAYAHNEKLLVSENDIIKRGQKIGLMGDSGTDNVHLHFEIRYKGKSVDPLKYLEKR